MQSSLGQVIAIILEKFQSLGVSKGIAAGQYYNLLPPSERNEYIQHYERFWFTFDTIMNIVKEMGLLIEELEKWKGENASLDRPKANMRLLLMFWKSICNDIYTLISLLVQAKIIPSEWFKEYREIRYIYLLRKDFIQHPEFDHPFSVFALTAAWSHDEKYLPYCNFGPTQGGEIFYFVHHQAESCILSNDWEEIAKINKELLIVKGGWKKLSIQEKNQLKGWGIDKIDQAQFANELTTLFENYIFPFLSKMRDDARNKNVIFDVPWR